MCFHNILKLLDLQLWQKKHLPCFVFILTTKILASSISEQLQNIDIEMISSQCHFKSASLLLEKVDPTIIAITISISLSSWLSAWF